MECSEPHFCVLATAGAGKTRVLVERYLWHVITDGFDPSRILTLTFARVAAAEMRGRIVERLRSVGMHDAARSAETGPVETIDAFMHQLLRENAFAAGVDPEFKVQNRSDAELISSALQRVLSDFEQLPQGARAYVYRHAAKTAWRVRDALYGSILADVMDCLLGMRKRWLPPERFEALYASAESTLAAWEELIRAQPGFEGLEPGSPGTLAERVATVASRLPARRDWAKKRTTGNLMVAAEETCGLVLLSVAVWREMLSEMYVRQEFDFTELALLSEKLVTSDTSVRRKVQEHYAALLVDEGQDVSDMQFRVLDGLGIQRSMMVGDPLQRLYAFRGVGDQFERRARRGHCLELTENFRSTPPVIAGIDKLMGLVGDEVAPGRQVSSQPSLGLLECNRELGGPVVLWVRKMRELGYEYRDLAVLIRAKSEAPIIIAGLRAQNIPVRAEGTNETLLTTMELRDLANLIQALADPSDDFALLALLHSPFCGLSTDAIAALAALEAPREMLASVTLEDETDQRMLAEFRRWFEPLAEYADRFPVWEVLARAVSHSGALERLARQPDGLQKIANTRKVMREAIEAQGLSPAEFAARLRLKINMTVKEVQAELVNQGADAVSVMTIHAAKGLEFPCVLLPAEIRASQRSDLVQFAPECPVVIKAQSSAAADKNLMVELVTELNKAANQLEERRVLFVGLSRAESHLTLGVEPRRKCLFLRLHRQLEAWLVEPPDFVTVFRQDER